MATGSTTFKDSTDASILPEDVLQDFYSPLSFDMTGMTSEPPFLLPSDDATKRAINGFDRNSTIDGHKVGVIYIGDKQSSEQDIFANVTGSADYTGFISELGTLIKLKGAAFNTQGLDRESDADGAFAICWRDRVSEIVFHITTMMPTDLDIDPQCINKKRHTGNDYVNIVFNDSGLPFKFDTFPSAFNFVYIVITPEARASFIETRHFTTDQYHDLFYKVQVMSKPGFPEISPASETKLVSGRNLASFVRLIALNASVFSLVWANREGGEHVSPWRNRLREINKLRDKHCPKWAWPPPPSTPSSSSHAQGSGGQTLMASPPARESLGFIKRASAATFVSDASRNSTLSLLSSNETDKQDAPKN